MKKSFITISSSSCRFAAAARYLQQILQDVQTERWRHTCFSELKVKQISAAPALLATENTQVLLVDPSIWAKVPADKR